jgi:hypothetical protein
MLCMKSGAGGPPEPNPARTRTFLSTKPPKITNPLTPSYNPLLLPTNRLGLDYGGSIGSDIVHDRVLRPHQPAYLITQGGYLE